MGTILCARRSTGDDGVILEVLLTNDEVRQLRGEMDGVVVFSDRTATVSTRMSLRGRNAVTRYFLVPRQLRKGLPVHAGLSCQRLEVDGKVLFVYVLDPLSRGTRLGS